MGHAPGCLVRRTAASHYRGQTDYAPGSPIGHEFIGVVEEIGPEVRTVTKGDFVISPWSFSDGTCPHCRYGITTACLSGGFIPRDNGDVGQGEAVRVPLADGTLVKVPGAGHSEKIMALLLTLCDVMGTGYHAAVCARVKSGDTVAVVGDGAVGLCGVIAAERLGAERIIALSPNPARQVVAGAFGATDFVAARGEQATAEVLELTGGTGADATLECVGTGQSMQTALSMPRPGSMIGYVGLPHRVELPVTQLFPRNKGVQGGTAPVRTDLPELLDDVLDGRINPGRVFDFTTTLGGVADGYAAMDQRRAIKALLHISSSWPETPPETTRLTMTSITPIWFIIEDGCVVFCTAKESAKGKALTRDPRATLCVDLEQPPYSCRCRGAADLSEDPDDLLRLATTIAARCVARSAPTGSANAMAFQASWWSACVPARSPKAMLPMRRAGRVERQGRAGQRTPARGVSARRHRGGRYPSVRTCRE